MLNNSPTTLLELGWTLLCLLKNFKSCHTARCWKHPSEILDRVDMIGPQSYFTSIMGNSSPTKVFSIGFCHQKPSEDMYNVVIN